jgi:aspartyl-tRNA(Asn)/glutamyl-tRNA(Gln) amidotransferase subunit A
MMTNAELIKLSLRDAAAALADGRTTSVALCSAFLERIQAVEPKVRALLAVNAESALAQAAVSDARRAAGAPLSLFDGVPVTLKDNICTKGEQCSCASKILKGFISPYDSFVTGKLKAAGCVLLGRANMDEFAMGSSCENSAYQRTANPWNLDCVPGGSSGGSAASVAALETVAALGSDTGGSIRQPAAFCGVVGLKPTYGRVSRNGLVAFASSLDQIGPLSRTVWDAAAILDLIAAHDEKDSTSLPQDPADFAADLEAFEQNPRLDGVKIGLPKEYYELEGMDPAVKRIMNDSIEVFRSLGATFVDVSLPHTKYAMACYYIIATAEASANLARFDGIRYGYRSPNATDINSTYEKSRGEGFGSEVLRRIMLGTYVLSSGYYDAYYLRAQKVRTLLRRDFQEAYKLCDFLLTPVTPAPAFHFGAKTDPLQMYLSDVFTTALNLSGDCGLSVPAALDPASGLPVGIQLIAPALEEKRIFRAGRAFELARAQKDFTAPLA